MLCGHLARLNQLRIVLGSKSQPRRTLLEQAGLKFEIADSGFAEDLNKADFVQAADYVRATALGKMESFLQMKDLEFDILITCDSIVVFEDTILEKPADKDDHASMMKKFSNKSNQVLSHVFVAFKKDGKVTVKETSTTTDLVFGEIPDEATQVMAEMFPSLLGAAGGYQIQTFSASIIKEIRGSHSGVIGLPMYEFSKLLLDGLAAGLV